MLSLTRQLLIVGCSATKVESHGELPAISLYDGPAFRTLRAFLRERHWPETLSVAVLSARHGLIGGLTPIGAYDQRMTRYRAAELRGPVTATLLNWKRAHSRIDLVIGKDYLRSIAPSAITDDAIRVRPGPIGKQLNHIAERLRQIDARIRPSRLRRHGYEPRCIFYRIGTISSISISISNATDFLSGGVERDVKRIP